jgi:hypothetical protein
VESTNVPSQSKMIAEYGSGGWKACTLIGSLRWHYPDRFDGYDLSPHTASTPARESLSRTMQVVKTDSVVALLTGSTPGNELPGDRSCSPLWHGQQGPQSAQSRHGYVHGDASGAPRHASSAIMAAAFSPIMIVGA